MKVLSKEEEKWEDQGEELASGEDWGWPLTTLVEEGWGKKKGSRRSGEREEIEITQSGGFFFFFPSS